MDLDEGALKLIDPETLTILNSQPIHTIRVWGVGRDNGRYVMAVKIFLLMSVFVLLKRCFYPPFVKSTELKKLKTLRERKFVLI